MKTTIRQMFVLLASITIWLPQVATASEQVVNDVKLWAEGVLLGQVVDVEGQPVAGTVVTLREGEDKVGETKTDAQGYFSFRGLASRGYVVEAAGGLGMYRAWSQSVAPPSAQPGVLIVAGKTTVRAHFYHRHRRRGGYLWAVMANHPYLTAALVGAAIAIPISVGDDRGPSSP